MAEGLLEEANAIGEKRQRQRHTPHHPQLTRAPGVCHGWAGLGWGRAGLGRGGKRGAGLGWDHRGRAGLGGSMGGARGWVRAWGAGLGGSMGTTGCEEFKVR